MAFPSTISSFTNPLPTQRLNSPSHSSIETAQNTGIVEIQNFMGTTTTSTVGTLIYDARSPDSNGGGHIQSVDKGGTGLTSYTKGDLLVATSTSVISKLAVGTNGFFLSADSSQAAGVKWTNSGSKVQIVSSQLGVSGVTTDTVVFAASVLGSVLGTSNAVRFTGAISQLNVKDARGINFVVTYGNNTLLSFGGSSDGDTGNLTGTIEGTIIGNGAVNSQKAVGKLFTAEGGGGEQVGATEVGVTKFVGAAYGTSSIESSATQNLIIKAQMTGANTFGSVLGQFFVIEKIN